MNRTCLRHCHATYHVPYHVDSELLGCYTALNRLGARSEMTSVNDERRERGSFPLTRMIYAIGCAILLYKSLEFCSWFLFRKMQNLPWGLYRFDVWIGFANLLFITIMLAVSLPYRPKADVFRWSS